LVFIVCFLLVSDVCDRGCRVRMLGREREGRVRGQKGYLRSERDKARNWRAWGGDGETREDGERRTGDKQSISFLPSYLPRRPPQLRVPVRNILLIWLSVSLLTLFFVFLPPLFLSASDTHPDDETAGVGTKIKVSKRYEGDIQIITGVADANFPTSSSICMIFLILA
jgi:hypothetical protein